MTDSLLQTYGAVAYPPSTAQVTADGTLTSRDPARDVLLELLAAAITAELGDVWNLVKAGTPLADRSVVHSKLPLQPTEQIVLAHVNKYPLLAVYRKGNATEEEFTLDTDRSRQQWGIDYVLGTLGADDVRKVGDILLDVARIISRTVNCGGHPAYQSGAVVLLDTAGFSTVRVVGWNTDPAAFGPSGGEQSTYYAAGVTLETTELTGFVEGQDVVLDGAQLESSEGNGAGHYYSWSHTPTEDP